MRLVFSSPYLRAIAAVICISSLVTTLTGWQFLAIAQQTLVKKDAIAIFFGNFYFYAGILSLLFQLLLTTRFLRKFGIGTALFVLPSMVFLGSAGLLAFGTLSAAVVLKGCDQTLALFPRQVHRGVALPAPSCPAQDTGQMVHRHRDLAHGGRLVRVDGSHLRHHPALVGTPGQLDCVAAGEGWLVAVAVVRKEYVATLKESISQHRVDVEQVSTSVLDRSTAELLATNLTASDPKEILYALSLFEVERQRAAHPVIRGLLSHPSPEVRQKAITILSESGDTTVRADIEPLLRDPDLNVRTEALLYLTHYAHVDPLELIQDEGDFADFSVSSAVVAFLARPGETQILEAAQQILTTMVGDPGEGRQRHRIEAARLLGELPDSFRSFALDSACRS